MMHLKLAAAAIVSALAIVPGRRGAGSPSSGPSLPCPPSLRAALRNQLQP